MRSSTLSATDFIRKASATAHHFGFRDLQELREDARCKNCAKMEKPKFPAADRKQDALHGILASGAAAYFDHNLHGLGEPALFYSIEEVPRSTDIAITLQILGNDKSIAESLLIHTVRALFLDLGAPDHTVRINSVGDRESMARYARELGNYLKKRIDFMPPQARELMKDHVTIALMHLLERQHELGFKSPSPLEYLNESSRKHFREIIEYLDFSETPYEIDMKLLGHHQCYSQTLFAIDPRVSSEGEQAPLSARGGRYDEFIYQATKKNIPAAGAVVTLRGQKAPAKIPRQRLPRPQVFMVQLGFGPKLKSLMILEEMRRAGIPVYQALASDSLSAQLERARAHGVPYTVILGQKEYVENTAIIRNMNSSSQESVPLSGLVAHLRKAVRA
jgi:histidyl-tRNA synthetase